MDKLVYGACIIAVISVVLIFGVVVFGEEITDNLKNDIGVLEKLNTTFKAARPEFLKSVSIFNEKTKNAYIKEFDELINKQKILIDEAKKLKNQEAAYGNLLDAAKICDNVFDLISRIVKVYTNEINKLLGNLDNELVKILNDNDDLSDELDKIIMNIDIPNLDF